MFDGKLNTHGFLRRKIDSESISVACAFASDKYCGFQCAAFNISNATADITEQFFTCARSGAVMVLAKKIVEEEGDVDVDIKC